MITVKEKPDMIVLGENPVIVILETDNMYSAAGEYATGKLTFSSKDVAGAEFTLNWGVYSETFTCADSPDDSGNEYKADNGSYSMLSWLQLLKTRLLANYNISRDFDITATTTYVKLTARTKGSDYTLTCTDSTSEGVFTATAGVDQVSRTNYEIFLQTFIKDNASFRKVGEDAVTPFENKAEYDVSEYLRPELTSNITYPEPNTAYSSTILKKHPEVCKEYRLSYIEKYDGAQRQVNYLPAKYVLKGGISKQLQGYLRQTRQTFFTWIQTKGFLSWHPYEKTVTETSVEKLYWLNTLTNPINIVISIHVHFTDGTSATIIKDLMTTQFGEVVEVVCSFNKMNPGSGSPSKTVDYYIVNIKKQGGFVVYSPPRLFRVDRNSSINTRQFIFRNGFGVFETVLMTGERVNKIEYERVQIKQMLPYTFTNKDAELRNERVFENQVFVGNTGWKKIEYINWMRDFMNSREIYEIDNLSLLPIVVTSQSVQISADDSQLYNLEIEYRRAYTDEHYSIDASIKKDMINYAVPMFDPNQVAQVLGYA